MRDVSREEGDERVEVAGDDEVVGGEEEGEDGGELSSGELHLVGGKAGISMI